LFVTTLSVVFSRMRRWCVYSSYYKSREISSEWKVSKDIVRFVLSTQHLLVKHNILWYWFFFLHPLLVLFIDLYPSVGFRLTRSRSLELKIDFSTFCYCKAMYFGYANETFRKLWICFCSYQGKIFLLYCHFSSI
jgi:hypothetical protein